MAERTGEKVGWIGGWMGGFLWLFFLSIVWLVRDFALFGILGLGLFILAVSSILVLAPWRFPTTPYWKLMTPIYAILVTAVCLAVWREGISQVLGSHWEMVPGLIPVFLPYFMLSRRRWIQH